jgi:hypothetical protein
MSSAVDGETMNWLLITSNSEKMSCPRRLHLARHQAWRCFCGKE